MHLIRQKKIKHIEKALSIIKTISINYLPNSVNKIIWFDISDSTSVTHFEVMPFIDLYLKKQIFKDKKNYQRKLYGGRIFTDYFHKKYSINDEKNFNQ